MELELKTWKQNFEQEKLSHEEDLARFNTVKKDLIVSKEESNTEALKGLAVTLTLSRASLRYCLQYTTC